MRKRSGIYIENESRWSYTRQDETERADLVAAAGKPPSHRPTSSPLPSTTPALVLLGQRTDRPPHGCARLDDMTAGCSAHPPVPQFKKTGLETSTCRTNFFNKV